MCRLAYRRGALALWSCAHHGGRQCVLLWRAARYAPRQVAWLGAAECEATRRPSSAQRDATSINEVINLLGRRGGLIARFSIEPAQPQRYV